MMGLRRIDLDEGFPCYIGGEMEARFIYTEIFQDDCYDLPGTPEAPFVIDVGANIGLFSIYMKRKHPGARILAFEPAPRNVEALHRNLRLHGIEGVTVHPVCLGAERSDGVPLTYYPELPGNSTLYPGDKRLQRAKTAEVLGRERTDELFAANEVTVPVERLSSILAAHPDEPSIDVLKIDVEGAELDVLAGIDAADWPRVQAVQLELADFDGRQDTARRLLEDRGFVVAGSPVPVFSDDLRLFYLIARRPDCNTA